MTTEKVESLLAKFRTWASVDSAKARAYVMRLPYKEDSYLLHCIAQTYLDESRFIKGSNKLRKVADQRKWRMAEKYIIRSFKLDNDNGEALYTMGKIRKLGRQNEVAIYCFKRIIKLGINTISKQRYSRGKSFAKELINDARFELYRLYFDTDRKKSMKYLREYKMQLKKGANTLFYPLKKFL